MDYFYQVYTANGDLVVSTRSFDLALDIYAYLSAQGGKPRFIREAVAGSFPVLLIPD